MACKIEIRKTIDQSILDKTENDFWGFAEKQARTIAVSLNSLWGNIASATQSIGEGGWRITTSRIPEAVDREYVKQSDAEKSFERDLDFFNNDRVLYEQEQKDLENQDIISPVKVKPGVQELFDSTPELANAVCEVLGVTSKLKVSLGKELEYKDPYVKNRIKDFKKYEVLNENGNNIGTVVIENRGNKTVILHPELSIIGKGYGKELYKSISSELGVTIQEWTEGAISRSDSAKKMWDSLEKEGSAIRIFDEEQGDNFRQLTYKPEITPQQKQQALEQYSAYLDSIFPDSKVKDIVYRGTPENYPIKKGISPSLGEGITFTSDKQWAKTYTEGGNNPTLYSALINIKTPIILKDNIDNLSEKEQNEYIKEKSFNENDGTISLNEFLVSEPEQIHILGNEQDVQEFKNYVAKKKGGMLQLKGRTETSAASPKTIATIKTFLKAIGVNINTMDEIVVNGVKQDAKGAALLMQKLIQVVNGEDAGALPEEAMHFAVEIIKQTNPKLYNQLLKEINNYQLYYQVLADYSTNPLYQTKDGKPNIQKLKDEAIAKVLAETVIKRSEGSTEKPENLVKAQAWWKNMIDWFKSLIIKSGFDRAAMDVISGKAIGTAEDIRAEQGDVYLQQAGQSRQDVVFNSIKDLMSKIDDRGEDGYYINGKKISRRVSDEAKNWYERIFADKKLTDSEFTEAVNKLKQNIHIPFVHSLQTIKSIE